MASEVGVASAIVWAPWQVDLSVECVCSFALRSGVPGLLSLSPSTLVAMTRNSDMVSAWAPASGDVPMVTELSEAASGNVPEPEPLDIALAGDDVPPATLADDGWLSVGSARWARVTRALLRVYALKPLFWHRRIFWAKRDEALAAARRALADGQLQLQ